MSEVKNTGLATTGYAALAENNIVNEAMEGEYAGLEFSLDRVKLPAGGGTAFELPAEDGEETEMEKALVGVVLFNHPAYAFYQSAFTGGHAVPDCSSTDGVTGVGTPGGHCADCPYNRFGSGEGQSKACKNKRLLYILREGELFPLLLSLPTGSLKNFTNYVKRQLTKGRKISQVVTRITLKKATSSTGVIYSQAVFTFERMLSPEETAALVSITENCRNYAANMTPAMIAEDDGEDIPFVDPETGEIVKPLN